MKHQKIIEALVTCKGSAWDKAVALYAVDLVEQCQENDVEITRENMLNGAKDWTEYSYGGCSLIYDKEIAERVCTPSELKRKKCGELMPNSRETWLDVQARALIQACGRVLRLEKTMKTVEGEVEV
jgi:hypothetical protein